IRDGGEDNCFLGSGGDFFLTLFRGDRPGLNHYCYAIKDYDADRAEEKLKAAGLKPRREGNRVYFHDTGGMEGRVAGACGATAASARRRRLRGRTRTPGRRHPQAEALGGRSSHPLQKRRESRSA